MHHGINIQIDDYQTLSCEATKKSEAGDFESYKISEEPKIVIVVLVKVISDSEKKKLTILICTVINRACVEDFARKSVIVSLQYTKLVQ